MKIFFLFSYVKLLKILDSFINASPDIAKKEFENEQIEFYGTIFKIYNVKKFLRF